MTNDPNAGGAGEPVSTATGELYGYDEAATRPGRAAAPGVPALLRVLSEREQRIRRSRNELDAQLRREGVGQWNQRYGSAVPGRNRQVHPNGRLVAAFQHRAAAVQMLAASGGYQFLDPRSNLIYAFNSSGALTSIRTATATRQRDHRDSRPVAGQRRAWPHADIHLHRFEPDGSAGPVRPQREFRVLRVGLFPSDGRQRQALHVHLTSAGSLTALMTAETRPTGNKPFTQQFDSQGRVSSQSDSLSNALNFAYSSSANSGSTTTLTEPLKSR